MLHHADERQVLDRVDPEPRAGDAKPVNVPLNTESPTAAASMTT